MPQQLTKLQRRMVWALRFPETARCCQVRGGVRCPTIARTIYLVRPEFYEFSRAPYPETFTCRACLGGLTYSHSSNRRRLPRLSKAERANLRFNPYDRENYIDFVAHLLEAPEMPSPHQLAATWRGVFLQDEIRAFLDIGARFIAHGRAVGLELAPLIEAQTDPQLKGRARLRARLLELDAIARAAAKDADRAIAAALRFLDRGESPRALLRTRKGVKGVVEVPVMWPHTPREVVAASKLMETPAQLVVGPLCRELERLRELDARGIYNDSAITVQGFDPGAPALPFDPARSQLLEELAELAFDR